MGALERVEVVQQVAASDAVRAHKLVWLRSEIASALTLVNLLNFIAYKN